MQWFRIWNTFLNSPKWALVAKRAGCSKHEVIAVVLYLMDFASRNEERGSIEGFDEDEIEAVTDVTRDVTVRIVTELDALKRGPIANGKFKKWEKYQAIDPTAADRKRRQREREKEKEKQQLTKSSPETNPEIDKDAKSDVTGAKRDVTDVTRDVTPDKNRKEYTRTESSTPLTPLHETSDDVTNTEATETQARERGEVVNAGFFEPSFVKKVFEAENNPANASGFCTIDDIADAMNAMARSIGNAAAVQRELTNAMRKKSISSPISYVTSIVRQHEIDLAKANKPKGSISREEREAKKAAMKIQAARERAEIDAYNKAQAEKEKSP